MALHEGALAPAALHAALLSFAPQSRPARASDLRSGVDAVRTTVLALGAISDDTCDCLGRNADGRDYVLMTGAVELMLLRASAGTAAYREGVCRALVDILVLAGEEWMGEDGAERAAAWNPLATSDRAFAAARTPTPAAVRLPEGARRHA